MGALADTLTKIGEAGHVAGAGLTAAAEGAQRFARAAPDATTAAAMPKSATTGSTAAPGSVSPPTAEGWAGAGGYGYVQPGYGSTPPPRNADGTLSAYGQMLAMWAAERQGTAPGAPAAAGLEAGYGGLPVSGSGASGTGELPGAPGQGPTGAGLFDWGSPGQPSDNPLAQNARPPKPFPDWVWVGPPINAWQPPGQRTGINPATNQPYVNPAATPGQPYGGPGTSPYQPPPPGSAPGSTPPGPPYGGPGTSPYQPPPPPSSPTSAPVQTSPSAGEKMLATGMKNLGKQLATLQSTIRTSAGQSSGSDLAVRALRLT